LTRTAIEPRNSLLAAGIWNIAVAVAYVAFGYLGILVSQPIGNVTILWPPAGIMVFAVLIAGWRVAPGIFLGVLTLNFLLMQEGQSLVEGIEDYAAILAIATGGVLQPLAAAPLVRAADRFGHGTESVSRYLGFFGAVAVASLIGATIGAAALFLSGAMTRDALLGVWATWYMGDLLGILLFTPLLVALLRLPLVARAILVLFGIMGFSVSYVVATAVNEDARMAWEANAGAETNRASSTLLLWLERSYAPLIGLSVLFQNNTLVSEAEFLEAVATFEDHDLDFFPETVAFVTVRGSAGTGTDLLDQLYEGGATLLVRFSTNETGIFEVGARVSNHADILSAARAAFDESGTVTLGAFIDRGGIGQAAVVTIAVDYVGTPALLIGVIDLTAMLDGLEALQVPEGLNLHMVARPFGAGFDTPPRHIYGVHAMDGVLKQFNTRGSTAFAEYEIHWFVTEDFLGGPGSSLADLILIFGVFGTTILSLFLAFLLGQNARIRQRVLERTAELERSREELARNTSILTAVMESISQGLVAFDADLRMIACNSRFLEIRDYPREIAVPGRPFEDFMRYDTERAEFGDGNPDALVAERMDLARKFDAHDFERTRPNGTILHIQGGPIPTGGFVSTFTDITDRRLAEQALASAHAVVVESIEYASRIQQALLPEETALADAFEDHGVLWEPRDGVGGDLYWHGHDPEGDIIALYDCTGHGVPGALMTMIVNSALSTAHRETRDPAKLIARANQIVQSELRQTERGQGSNDGFEIGICWIDAARETLVFAGARFDLYIADGADVRVTKGDRVSLGYRETPWNVSLKTHEIALETGRRFFLSSDGIIDQIGETRRRGFGKKRLIAAIAENADGDVSNQVRAVGDALNAHQGAQRRRDDIAMIGVQPL
jgi:serine phosphatase RsbU (regulator of sigma subunit)/PAS domain-containing protein